MAKCAVRRTPLQLRLWFYIIQELTNALRKNLLSMANGRITFFIVIYRFSFVKAAMNSPRVCKLHENCLTGIDQCAMVLKTPKFLRFPKNMFQVRSEFSPPLSKLVA
jgi:hypothetical protein